MSKFITWIKSLSWIVIGGAVFAAVGMILRAISAEKLEAQVEQGETEIKQLNKGTANDIKAAAEKQVKIDVKKVKAREIRKKAEKHQERIGQHETMADIAARFNGKRVRSREDTAAELRRGDEIGR